MGDTRTRYEAFNRSLRRSLLMAKLIKLRIIRGNSRLYHGVFDILDF